VFSDEPHWAVRRAVEQEIGMPISKPDRDRPGQKDAESRISDLKDRGGPFVAAVEATRMPMVVTDPTVTDNPIIYANSAFLEMCGYEMDEVLGQNYLFLAGPNTGPEMENEIKAALSARQNTTAEVRFYRKDGMPIWVASFISPVQEGDRIVQHFASFIEITRRVELEHELTEAKAALERRVARRTRKLEQANARLEEEVERRSRMEAVLRDTLTQREKDLEYQTFLVREIDHRTKNALHLAGALLQFQVKRTGDPAAADALKHAQNQLERMAEVHALLYEGGQPDSIDFAAYLRRIARELGEALQPVPGQVAIEVDAEDVHCGPDLAIPLGLLVGEAITNAMKHAFPEGRKGRISVRLRATGSGSMNLTIDDDGVGLPGERRKGSLGLELIETFARQIQGNASIGPGRDGGTRVDVAFPGPNTS
jgi:PAS domain S-box-containing protein